MALISVGGSTPPKMGRSGSANAELEPSVTRLATRIAWIFTRVLPDEIFPPENRIAHDRPRLRRSLGGHGVIATRHGRPVLACPCGVMAGTSPAMTRRTLRPLAGHHPLRITSTNSS